MNKSFFEGATMVAMILLIANAIGGVIGAAITFMSISVIVCGIAIYAAKEE